MNVNDTRRMNFKKTTQVANKLKGPIVVINIFLQGTHLFFFCVNLYLSSSLHLNFFLYSHSFLLTLPQSAAIITQNKDLRLSQVFQLLIPARIWSDGLRHAAVVANSTNPPQVCRSGLAFRGYYSWGKNEKKVEQMCYSGERRWLMAWTIARRKRQ